MKITILRLGHRIHRDYRMTTHCALVARAFGASEMYYCGNEDDKLISTIHKINDSWGGEFTLHYASKWRPLLKKYKKENYFVILCTMYGENIPNLESQLRKKFKTNNILIVIGSEKIPSELFDFTDINIAISNQPHSEVAALAIILDRIHGGKQLKYNFKNSKIDIIPKKKGKKAVYSL